MIYWAAVFLGITLSIVFLGALLGGLVFLLVGVVSGMEYPVGELLKNGIFDGGFLALIWAPGTSIVACLVLAHKRRKKAGELTGCS